VGRKRKIEEESEIEIEREEEIGAEKAEFS
jgi:hypothetical protein